MRKQAKAKALETNTHRGRVILALAFGAVAAALLAMASAAKAEDVAAFYKGKQIDVYSGHSKGGSYSVYARLVARHIGKHVPGNPTAVYRSKPGASGLVLAHWLNAAAPKDGLSIGTFHERIGLEPLIAPEGIKFDGRDFTWLIALARNVSVCFTWHTHGIKSVDDAKAKEIIVGASGATATDAIMPRVMNATLGTKFRIINGYEGSDSLLAMERGELQGRCGFGYASLKAVKPDWLRDKKINIIAQFSVRTHPEIKEVPLLIDLVKSEDDKSAIALADGTGEMARPYAAPPKLPADRANALRRAFEAMVKDKDFLADANKQRLEIDPTSGEAIEAMLDKLYKTPKAVAQRMITFRSPVAGEQKLKQ
ncbi:MAG: hypothetical protein RLZ98_1661 [Pseudomonadota bacterium]|jgi:tripartite-type tricarboxylate transporter receptor subunit TctC